MPIHNIPEIFLEDSSNLPDLFVYDFKMNEDVVKDKVDLGLNMFSFLQTGQKQVHFANTVVAVNESQSLIIENGNCLFTELLSNDKTYFCKLLFFSSKKVSEFLSKYKKDLPSFSLLERKEHYFIIENDDYIRLFVNSLSTMTNVNNNISQRLLTLKFEEIMLYLSNKYGVIFIEYLYSLLTSQNKSTFNKNIESNQFSNLKLEEVAFLCNMSLSTFKRHFTSVYKVSPGKWFQQQRLNKAKELLQDGKHKPSEIYQDFGYDSLSNFSIAFKNEFGFSPKKTSIK